MISTPLSVTYNVEVQTDTGEWVVRCEGLNSLEVAERHKLMTSATPKRIVRVDRKALS